MNAEMKQQRQQISCIAGLTGSHLFIQVIDFSEPTTISQVKLEFLLEEIVTSPITSPLMYQEKIRHKYNKQAVSLLM